MKTQINSKIPSALRKLSKRQLKEAILNHTEAIDVAREALKTARTRIIKNLLYFKIEARQTAIKEIEALQKEKNTSNEKDQTVLLQRH